MQEASVIAEQRQGSAPRSSALVATRAAHPGEPPLRRDEQGAPMMPVLGGDVRLRALAASGAHRGPRRYRPSTSSFCASPNSGSAMTTSRHAVYSAMA